MRARTACFSCLLVVATATPAIGAPSFEGRGWPGPSRELAGHFAGALRAPRDSAALALGVLAASLRLQSLGHLEGRVRAEWTGEVPLARLQCEVVPGPRHVFAPVEVVLVGADSALVAGSLASLAGEAADAARFERALGDALESAERSGHAWAQLAISEWRIDGAQVRTRVTGTLGPKVTVTDVRLDGLVVTRPELARRSMGRLTGMPYRPTDARAAAERLRQLGVFRSVEFLGLEGGADWREGVLAYRVEEPRYNRIEGAVGVQGETGVVGLARFELGNLLGTGRSVGLDWQRRGSGLSDLGARYREPLILGWPLAVEVNVAQQLQDTLYTRDRFGLRGLLAVNPRDRVEMGYEEERVVQTRGTLRSVELSNTMFALARDDRDDPFAPRRGTRARLAATQISRRERFEDGARVRSRASALDASIEAHRAVGRSNGMMLEVVTALRLSGQRVLGEFERAPLGGAATLRGHDEEAFRVDRHVRSRFEYRRFLGSRGERVHVFWDHAEMESREAGPTPGTSRLERKRADGLGFGLRLPAAGGLVDLDYGIEPGRGALDGRIHLRLVTAF